MSAPGRLPRWVDLGLLPLVSLLAAFAVSAAVIAVVGENPWVALKLLATGALGSQEAVGYTLYYATNFIFTGLAVALALHAGLFNIGCEGQAYIGGLGVGLVGLALDQHWPFWAILPAAVAAAAVGGAAWAFIPAWLQARRGSHIVITTIMFNFIASALMTYLLVNVLIKPGQQSPESRELAPAAWLPTLRSLLARVGITISSSPLNLAFLVALAAAAFVWIYVWHTRWGYALRVAGRNPSAAVYAGISPARVTVVTMLLSGALGEQAPQRREQQRRRDAEGRGKEQHGERVGFHGSGAPAREPRGQRRAEQVLQGAAGEDHQALDHDDQVAVEPRQVEGELGA
ncbi:MAG TPA: ABC transporter permease, partial [Opitutaceae bacterium]|nr:ABC transporter permease [Opitutaceae bacterium]